MFVALGVEILLSVVEITGAVVGVDFILLGSFFVVALAVVALFESPKRCTFPITAFLVTPPSRNKPHSPKACYKTKDVGNAYGRWRKQRLWRQTTRWS